MIIDTSREERKILERRRNRSMRSTHKNRVPTPITVQGIVQESESPIHCIDKRVYNGNELHAIMADESGPTGCRWSERSWLSYRAALKETDL